MYKVLITGGSGFIGTNLIEYYLKKNFTVLNLDIVPPKNNNHLKYWKNVDITNFEDLESEMCNFDPEFIIHLAARTDLNGSTMIDYKANTTGVSNVAKGASSCTNLKRIIFTSSMLVCKLGYTPKDENDFKPNTVYGESKVKSELIIREGQLNYEWSIIRPTSIWGPWFGEPYRNFFDMILSSRYFHIGNKSGKKTFGYVGNVIYQIDTILFAEKDLIQNKIFYIGDYIPYEIEVWGDEIASVLDKKIKKIPFLIIQLAAFCGDFLKVMKIPFMLTSFRLKNMTTDNIVELNNIKNIAKNLPYSRVEGIKITLKWLKNINT